jgi:Alpha-glutamyl/putrescinyl thymine pyrophosphorylase clade 3
MHWALDDRVADARARLSGLVNERLRAPELPHISGGPPDHAVSARQRLAAAGQGNDRNVENMWPSWEVGRRRIDATLRRHSHVVQPLPGITTAAALDTLALQFVASLRREAYYKLAQRKPISARRADPNDPSFDAERAVVYHQQQGNLDEAAWLVFLMTHFARPEDTGWRRLQDVYGMLGAGIWDWRTVSANPSVRGKFGNHRKYESLRDDAGRSTGKVVESYITWVGHNGHARLFADIVRQAGNDPHAIYDALYRSLDVKSFGRLAKFDYLSLIGRYSTAPIDAGSAYLIGATGPAKGARLLFDGRRDGPSSLRKLQVMLDVLDADLQVTMKVMEDALCNWQKSPVRFVHFKG